MRILIRKGRFGPRAHPITIEVIDQMVSDGRAEKCRYGGIFYREIPEDSRVEEVIERSPPSALYQTKVMTPEPAPQSKEPDVRRVRPRKATS